MVRSKWLIALLILYPLFLATACHSADSACDYYLIRETLSTLNLDKDPQKAMKMIRSCAEKGDSASQIALASVYLELPDKHRSEKIKQYFLWSKKAKKSKKRGHPLKGSLSRNIIPRQEKRTSFPCKVQKLPD